VDRAALTAPHLLERRRPVLVEAPMAATPLRSIALLLPMVMLLAGRPSTHQVPSTLVGRWEGVGVFSDSTLQAEAGPVPLTAEIAADGSGSGRMGKATLREVRVGQSRRYVEVRALLDTPVAAHRRLDKDRLVLVITRLDSATAESEFHLKSNFLFDPTMREGRITLKRVR
jgi:hypothetical protein